MTDKEPTTIRLSTLFYISVGIVIGVIASNNLDVQPNSEFQTASLYLQSPLEIDSTEASTWAEK